jgi:quinol monooxygenase YgiN
MRGGAMGDAVSWVLELAVKPGKLDEFRSLMKTMVDSTQGDEPGTLAYEWFIDDDGTNVHIYERYADSDALLAHVGNFGAKFAPHFMGCVDIVRFTIYGEPSDDVRGALGAFGPSYLRTFGGFAR